MRLTYLAMGCAAVLLSLSGCGEEMEIPPEDEALIGGNVEGQTPAEEEPGTVEHAITGCFSVGITLITNDNLNLRSGPSTTNSILLTMPLGSKVTLQQGCPSSGFYNVKYGTTTGWASGTYLNTMRTVTVTGGFAVRSHVQSYANAVCSATGACNISTYSTHHPTPDRALDILVSSAYGSLPSDNNYLGDRVAQMTLNQWNSYRTWYVIWKQRINYNDGLGWQLMEDRGTITKNHYDHVHTSFYE